MLLRFKLLRRAWSWQVAVGNCSLWLESALYNTNFSIELLWDWRIFNVFKLLQVWEVSYASNWVKQFFNDEDFWGYSSKWLLSKYLLHHGKLIFLFMSLLSNDWVVISYLLTFCVLPRPWKAKTTCIQMLISSAEKFSKPQPNPNRNHNDLEVGFESNFT